MDKTDNEIIAEFMGLAKSNGRYLIEDFPHTHASMYCGAESLDFHRSWDWLMPVAKKIIDMGLDSVQAVKIRSLRIDTELWELHLCVVEFIKWYNTQPKS